MNQRGERIKNAIFKWPYFLIFVISSFLYVLFSLYVNDSFLIFRHLGTLNKIYATFFVGFFIVVALLFSLTLNLAITRFRELGSVSSKEGGVAFFGTIGGILGGSCPACIAGFFPAIVGFFGLSFGLTDLPLLGLEIQIISVILFGISIWLLSNEPVCKVKIPIKK